MRPLVVAALAILFLLGVGASYSAGKKPCPGNSCRTTTAQTTTAASCASSPDQTQAVLAQIAATPDGGTVTFNGCYRIEGTIELFNRHLTLDGGTFESFNAPTDQRAIWRTWNSTVTFNDMSIVGSYTNGGTLDQTLQHAHGIDLRASVGQVNNVRMSDLAGDCVYFGLGSSGGVQGGSCTSIGRNGVSVVSANNVLVQGMAVSNVGFDAFDVEPNAGTGAGSTNIRFNSNTIGTGIYLSTLGIVPNEPLSNLFFTKNSAQTIKVDTADTSFRPQGVTVTGNTSTLPGHMQFDYIDHLAVSGNSNVTVTETGCTP